MKRTLHFLCVIFLVIASLSAKTFAAGPQPAITGPQGPTSSRPIGLTITLNAPATTEITAASLQLNNAILNNLRRNYSITYKQQADIQTQGNALYTYIDKNGLLYVADEENDYIYIYNAANPGIPAVKIGGPGNGQGKLDSPGGIVTDAAGNIYVSDQGNHCIVVYSSAGAYLRDFGTAQLTTPAGLAIDASGNVYVTDEDENKNNIQVFNSAGTYLSSFGSTGSNTNTQFNTPTDIKIDAAGYIYIADANNNRVQVYQVLQNNWTYIRTIGTGLIYPRGIALDGLGNIAIANNSNAKLQVYNTNGTLVSSYTSSQTGSGPGVFSIQGPSSIAADGRGNLFVADELNNRIEQFNTAENYTLSIIPVAAGNVTVTLPANTIFDADGNGNAVAVYSILYQTTNLNVTLTGPAAPNPTSATSVPITFEVTKPAQSIKASALTLTNTTVSNIVHTVNFGNNATFGGPTTSDNNGTPVITPGALTTPNSVALDERGYIYVGDASNYTIKVFSEDGQYVRSFGSSAQLSYTGSIAADGNGLLYLADKFNHRIEIFNTNTGALTATFGSNGAANGQFATPGGLYIERNTNKLYVADLGNNRIQVFNLPITGSPTPVLVFGTTGTGAGHLTNPNAVIADAAGNIYVADAVGRVQKFNSAGTFVSQIGSTGTGNGQFSSHAALFLATDGTDKLYVVDNAAARVQIFTTDGAYLGATGSNGTADGQLNSPDGIAIGKDGTLYISDQNNSRIETFKVSEHYTARINYVSDGLAKVELAANTITDAMGMGNPDAVYSITFDRTPPAQPTGLTATSLDAEIKLDWTANAATDGVNSYHIYRSTGVDPLTLLTTVSGSTLTYLDAGLTNGTTYNYQISAVDALGNESTRSNLVSSIPKANQTITFNTTVPDKTFGDPAFDITGLAKSSAGLTVIYSIASGPATINNNTIALTGAGTVTVRVTQPGNIFFNPAPPVTISFNVARNQPEIVWNDPSPITYGESLGSVQLNATHTVSGNLVYTPAAGIILQPGEHTLTATLTPTDNVNYAPVTKTVKILVNKLATIVSWNNPAAINYQTPLTGMQLNATFNVPGTPVYTPAANTILDAGTHTLSVTFTPDDTHYATITKNVQIVVNPIAPVITWNTPGAIIYGTPLTNQQLNASANILGHFVYTPDFGTVLTTGTTHTLQATFIPDDAVNYTSKSVTVNLVVNQAIPDINWANPQDIIVGTALSNIQLNASANVTGNFTYMPPAGTQLPLGNGQTLKVNFVPTDAVNYKSASKQVTINVINRLVPVITWSNPATITQGMALSGVQLNATANVAGTFVYTPAIGTVLPAGNGQMLSVTFTPTDAIHYTTATKTVTINVNNKLTPSVNWPVPAPINYGTALGSGQLNAQANVDGTFSYTPAAGTVLEPGAQTLSVTFTPTDAIHYNTVNKNVVINVNKLSPVITWAFPANITVGTPLGSTQLNATANIPGTFMYTPNAGTVLPAGINQTLSVTFNPTDAAHYNTATKSVRINVIKITPVITWTVPAAIIYGTALSNTQLNAKANVPGTLVYTPAAGTVLEVGNAQLLTVTFTPTDALNYNVASKTVTIDVKPNNTVVNWSNPAAITYGTALTALQLNATSPVSGTFVYTPAIGTVLNAGNGQKLSVTFTPADSHYAVITKNVSINVNKAALIVTADNQTKIYGQDNPPLTLHYTGFVNGDTETSLTQAASISTSASTGSSVGTYPIIVAAAISDNYSFTYVNGTFTITPASRLLTFNPLPSKTYGDADFAAGATISTGEAPVYTSSNTAVATVTNGQIHITGGGTTIITAAAPPNANYDAPAAISQILVVGKALQTITFNPIPQQVRGAIFDLSTVATSSSGLPITFVSKDPMIASISGQSMNDLRIGTTNIVATQPGDNNYYPANSVVQVVTIRDSYGHDLLVHPAVSPNGDGINDILYIEGIQDHPKNRVTLINRNGVMIYEINGYDNVVKRFDGRSNINGALQTAGTYFYLVEYITSEGEGKHITGYFVLKYHD